jgi:two-component system nitrogen regulation response regulator GlnG
MGGSLFLDEVAEIPLEIQVKLLRVLDQGEVSPVGSNAPVKTNFRLISATNQDVLSQINHGEFRQDLFYRLRTFEIKLPPLRQRKQDIPDLVDHFLRKYRAQSAVTISKDFIDVLKSRPWHGNVRELQSVVDRAATLSRGGLLTAEHVSAEENILLTNNRTQKIDQKIQQLIGEWTRQRWEDHATDDLYDELIALVEPAILATAFQLSENQYSAAARRLGIHRTTLKKKLDE